MSDGCQNFDRGQMPFKNKVKHKNKPTIVCLCGSTRFMDAFQKANLNETLKGNIVLSIGCNTKSDIDLIALGELTEEKKKFLDELHKRKIDLCDEVLILNVGGYIGNSTKSELEYAVKNNKLVRYLENKNYTIREMVSTDVEMCAKLIIDTYKKDGIWLEWTIENTIKDLNLSVDFPKYKEKYFVVELNNEIIGVGGVGESFMTSAAFELGYGTVKYEYQRRGIGTLLTLKRIEYVKSLKEHGYIFVSARYPKFFEKLGFVSVVNKTGYDDAGTGAFCCLTF